MKQGDEGNRISFDEQLGLVYFAKAGLSRAVHISACAWVETEDQQPAKK